jgi:hypothetical protein
MTMQPSQPAAEIPLLDQIAELERELGYRRRVFPKWIADGRMQAAAAARRMSAMEAALATLKGMQS